MNFGIWELVIILVIVALLFGTAKLRNIGGDLGGAIKSFRGAVREGEDKDKEKEKEGEAHLEDKGGDKESSVIEGEATREKDKA